LQAFIREAVAPHLVAREDPRQGEFLERLDEAIATRMRAVLHDPALSALESLWRSILFLVRNADTGTDLKIRLIDLSRAELVADLGSDAPIGETALSGLLRSTSADTPWSLVIGAYTFGPDARDAHVLARIADIARAIGAPVIAAGSPAFVGLGSFGGAGDPAAWLPPTVAEWEAFRRSAGARWIGLAMPRFLLRLPYGDGAEGCDAFAFEEMPAHDAYLWANPAFACARLLAETWSHAGADMRAGMHQDIGGLPYHIERVDGEAVPLPCAEMLMSERAASRMMELGFMPLASMKDSDAVRLVRFQSVAEPVRALAGRWHEG
jgi:type VI secretion system protein ImpC